MLFGAGRIWGRLRDQVGRMLVMSPSRNARRTRRVGLVLGAGGVMGGAWLAGALAALAERTGWDPASAEVIVGTSAGAMIGGLIGCGVPPWFMVAHSAGEIFEGLVDRSGRPVSEADRTAGAIFRPGGVWLPLPGSPRLALRSLRSRDGSLRSRLAGWAPAGVISTRPLEDVVRRAAPEGWADHPRTWLVACDYGTGERVVFGRAGAPAADLARAVAASCSIPGFYQPVRIGGRRFVDGGLQSLTNIDLLEGLDLDLVICFSPMSGAADPSRLPSRRMMGWVRAAARRELDAAASALRREGTDLVLFEPQPRDLEVMGTNFMSRSRRHAVIERALETVGAAAAREPRLRRLPRGEPDRVRRPAVAPAEWAWQPDAPAGAAF